jgi:hypothetical protein
MPDLYNKAALERLSNPEQLDKAITVSKPASWLALIGITLVFATAIVWSVLGTLPTVLPTQGITVQTDSAGQIVESYVPFSQLGKIDVGMRAVVYNRLDGSRYNAEVIEVIFDNALFTDMELTLNSDSIPVAVLLRLVDANLLERTLVTVNIITEEVAPIDMLFRGITDRIRR